MRSLCKNRKLVAEIRIYLVFFVTLHLLLQIGVLAKPPLTKQDNDKNKTKRKCAVYVVQHPFLCLLDFGKHLGD